MLERSYKRHFFGRHGLIIPLITLACLLPFANKAFHIDDPIFIWVARHIFTNPVDFYGFTANWYGLEEPMSSILINPPGLSYYIALTAAITGWSELSLHLSLFIPAIGMSYGTYCLARQTGIKSPWLAALIVVFSPVFLLCSTNIMADLMMSALYVWAVIFWLDGLEKKRLSYLFLSSLLISISALTKYFGITLVPLLLAFSLLSKKKLSAHTFILMIPVVILFFYEWLTYMLYGKGLLSYAAHYATEVSSIVKPGLMTNLLTGLSFSGGSLLSTAFFIPLLWSKKIWVIWGLVLLSVATLLLQTGYLGSLSLYDEKGIKWSSIVQCTLFIAAGIHIIVLAVDNALRSKDAISLLLFFWVIGTFIYLSLINWTISARTVLPMAPAVGVLLARRFDQLQSRALEKNLMWRATFPLFLGAIVAFLVSWADYSLANCQRTAVRTIYSDFKDSKNTLWFQGHWGFQYYMEAAGGKPLDFKSSSIKYGDIVTIPVNNTNKKRLSNDDFQYVRSLQIMPSQWIGTMQSSTGAGFYAAAIGPLPFTIGNIQPEEYLLYSAKKDVKGIL
ncbi:MAG: glycosyltransferase family 39 protein [Proteobacteria bacterium]|nr:glycosyltransferase family 39 protein [Pseudomonadota bacterium]